MQGNRSIFALLVIAAWLFESPAAFAATSTASESNPSDSQAADDHRRMAQRIDELLAAERKSAGVIPAPRASDGEFLRRAYLDLTGVIPRVSEVREFLADDRPEKRELLVEQLLASPRYATHMATTWRNRILPLGVDPERSREAVGLQKWLRTRFAKNLRYDNLVGELLLAIGGDELGPALYFQANDLSPEKLAASSAELFLGLKLECAQCHDHPFADWSQRDFWGLAAFFARVKAADDRMMMMRTSYRLIDADKGDVRLPESDEIVPPKYPRGDAAEDEERKSRRTQLALWMTSRDNQYFSRAAVNWAWTHMFGQGLVDSLDNIDPAKPTAQTRLLDELAAYFIDSGFDLKGLWCTLAGAQAYQLSSERARQSGGRRAKTVCSHVAEGAHARATVRQLHRACANRVDRWHCIRFHGERGKHARRGPSPHRLHSAHASAARQRHRVPRRHIASAHAYERPHHDGSHRPHVQQPVGCPRFAIHDRRRSGGIAVPGSPGTPAQFRRTRCRGTNAQRMRGQGRTKPRDERLAVGAGQ
jgi:hypothetical protein